MALGDCESFEVFKYAEEGYSFNWKKEGSTRSIGKSNTLNFSNVSESDFGCYHCEVKMAEEIIVTVPRALYKKEIGKFTHLGT